MASDLGLTLSLDLDVRHACTTVLVNMRLIYHEDIRDDLCVMIKNGRIADILSTSLLPSLLQDDSHHIVDCHQHFVSPGFIDLQVYGSGGMLFGTYPNTATLQRMERDLLAQGTTGFLVTMATNTLDVFKCGLEAAFTHSQSQEYVGNCWGVHLEGPYISPAKRGAHPLDLIRSASLQEAQMLLDQAKGNLKMMTLAPERVPMEVRRLLVQSGVILSSGHSNATLAEGHSFLRTNPEKKMYTESGNMERGEDSTTVKAVTHLYNAMPPLYHRPCSVGYIPAIFKHRPYTSIIADGIHVDYSMLALAKRELKDKLFLITDAVTETTEGVYQHHLHVEKKQRIHESTGEETEEETIKYVMPDGTLSGSALTMLLAVRNCTRHCDISLCEAVRMATLYPARLMGVSDCKGQLEVGYDADLCIFNDRFEVVSTFVKGKCVFQAEEAQGCM